jgi:solute:Na+ symporter, SSS family
MPVQPDITLLYPVVGYLVLMSGIGIWAYNKADTADDFLLAGRSLGSVIVAGTLLATWMGSGSITGGGNSIAYQFGIWPALLLGTAALIGVGVLRVLASQIRGYNKYTIPEILDEGIGKEAKAIGLVVIAVAYVGIVSYQFIGLGFVLNVTTGISVETGTLIAAVMIIGLAMLGGLMSVAYTDAISAFLMLIGLFIGLPFVLGSVGGWDSVTAQVPQSALQPFGTLTALQFLGYWAPVLLLILADQNMYQRIVAGRSDEGTNRGMIGWFIGVAVGGIVIPIIAFSARVRFPNIDPGMAMISMTTVIPRWVGGILLAAASAFIITTGNSYLLSASTNVSQDLYRGFINPEASDQQVFWLTRVTIVVLGLFAFILGQYFPTVLSIQILAYTAYGATITPALFAIFLMRDRLTKIGGVSGMTIGFIITILWDTVLGQPFELNAVIASAPIAALTIIVVSWMTNHTTKTSPVSE